MYTWRGRSSALPVRMLLMYQKHTQLLKTYLPAQNFPSAIAHLEHSFFYLKIITVYTASEQFIICCQYLIVCIRICDGYFVLVPS